MATGKLMVTDKGFRAITTICAGTGFIVAVFVPVLWLFSTDPELRRQVILFALGCALLCVLWLTLCQRSAGGWRSFSDVVSAEFSRAAEDPIAPRVDGVELPRVLPSRRSQQQRTLFWGFGVCAAIMGVIALAAGTPQRTELIERLHDAGAEFSSVRAEKVSDVRQISSSGRDPYTATVVVQLPDGDSESVPATVKAKTYNLLRPGDRVEVLYSPDQPHLGAVAGDERSLGSELHGETMPAYLRWSIIAAWVLGCWVVLNSVSRKHGFRAFSRLGERDKAIRGRYTRVGQYHHDGAGGRGEPARGAYLEVQTDAGWVHFLTDIAGRGVPESLQGQSLWLCWDTRRGARGSRFSPGRTPAALVFDSGWVIQGMLNANKAVSLRNVDVSVAKMNRSAEENRELRLWDPRAKWALYSSSLMKSLYIIIIAFAALLTFDVSNGWRWTIGVVGVLAVITAAGSYLNDTSQAAKADVT